MHAEASRVNGAVAVVRALGQALEVGLPNHQHRRAEPTFGDQAAHEQGVVVLETVRPNDYVDLAIGQNGAALRLDRDVLDIAEPVDQPSMPRSDSGRNTCSKPRDCSVTAAQRRNSKTCPDALSSSVVHGVTAS